MLNYEVGVASQEDSINFSEMGDVCWWNWRTSADAPTCFLPQLIAVVGIERIMRNPKFDFQSIVTLHSSEHNFVAGLKNHS